MIRGTSYTDLVEKLKKKEISRDEIWQEYVKAIQEHNPELNAFMCYDEELSKTETELPPIAVKDNVLTKHFPTTASSKVLEGFMSPYESTISLKLNAAGVPIVGKTNMDAWAHGSSTETSDYGPTRNPYNTDCVPGGSSGGSAAAVAAGLIPAAIGTETAGSIRLPAAWCGVVGLKPTYGRVSRYGIIAMGSSWDCPGPMTQTVEDAAFLLELLAGKDSYDATSLDMPVEEYRKELSTKRKLTIGYSEEFMQDVDPEIVAAVEKSIDTLKKEGHTIKNISLMSPKYAISVYMILQRSEVSSNLARYTGIRYGKDRSYFGDEAKKRIMLGTYALSSGYIDQYYKKAQKVRYMIADDFKRAFKDVDVIITPTTPITAPKIGFSEEFAFFGEMMDILSEPAAAAGIPAISIPIGMHSNGLPIGVQFMGNHFDEKTILNIAHNLEQKTSFDRVSVMKKFS